MKVTQMGHIPGRSRSLGNITRKLPARATQRRYGKMRGAGG